MRTRIISVRHENADYFDRDVVSLGLVWVRPVYVTVSQVAKPKRMTSNMSVLVEAVIDGSASMRMNDAANRHRIQ